jgi:hypothetical protein
MASTNKLVNVGGGLFIDADNNFNKNKKGSSRTAKGSMGTSVRKLAENMLTQQNAVDEARRRLQQKLEEIKKKVGK